MKKLIAFACAVFAVASISYGWNSLNNVPDSIIGDYEIDYQGELSKVRITKEHDGTYKAQVFWVKDCLDKHGNIRLDEKNPDKSLRTVPCDRIVLMSGLKYDTEKGSWGDTKVYDPTRGIKANVTASFQDDGRLRVKGSLLGISQSMYWKKL